MALLNKLKGVLCLSAALSIFLCTGFALGGYAMIVQMAECALVGAVFATVVLLMVFGLKNIVE